MSVSANNLFVSDNFVRDTCLSVTKEGEFYRLVWSRTAKKPGYEEIKKDGKTNRDNVSGDIYRFESSINRTRSLVRQYGLCNPWDYFVTFTISGDKWDRFDLRTFYKSFSHYINNLNYRRNDGNKLLYVLIPEEHKNGAWHFHGLMVGLPDDFIVKYELGMPMSSSIAKKVKSGEDVYFSPAYNSRFGYNTIEPIKSHTAIAFYITKYITKSALQTGLPRGYRFVLASHGLKKAKKLRQIYGISFTALKKYLGEFDYKTDDFAVLTFHPSSKGVDEEKWLQDIESILSKIEEEKNYG